MSNGVPNAGADEPSRSVLWRARLEVAGLAIPMPTRKKLSRSVASEVMDAVDLRCCMCPHRMGVPPRIHNGQIHHLDGDPSNGDLDNLAFLCLDCHERAGATGRAARTWSADLIARRRDRLVSRIEIERRGPRVSSGFRDALDAAIVMDLRSIIPNSEDEWSGKEAALWSLRSYPKEMGINARRAIVGFLYDLSGDARFQMPSRIAELISGATIDLLPSLRNRDNDFAKEDLDVPQTAAAIGGDLAYDGVVYCRKLRIVEAAGEILWRVLSYARSRRLPDLEQDARTYFEQAFEGAMRSGLPHSTDLLEHFKKHGEVENTLSIVVPDKILRALADEED